MTKIDINRTISRISRTLHHRIAACLTVGLGLLSLLSGLFDFGLGALSIILGLVLAANGVLLFFGVTCKSKCTIKVSSIEL